MPSGQVQFGGVPIRPFLQTPSFAASQQAPYLFGLSRTTMPAGQACSPSHLLPEPAAELFGAAPGCAPASVLFFLFFFIFTRRSAA